MAEVKWTSQAETDLEEIAFYIAFQDGRPITADNIVDEIRDKCRLYASQPEMGVPQADLGESIRSFTHKRWVVLYDEIENGIRIRAVVDAARDYPNRFP